jgi:glycosyltransferase involved in cell wall biosynthesis
MKNEISISIVTPTLNNEKDIARFINSIKRQSFPKKQLELVISDGGSEDKTLQIAKKMGARVIKNPYIFADPGVNLGIKAAKGNILMVLACDNIYKDKNALKKIYEVFNDKTITAAFPMHSSVSKDSLFTKYINRFTDPFNHFVYGYGANGRSFKYIYKTEVSGSIYDLYDFKSNKDKPLIAVAQGFSVRAGFTRSRKNAFDDILPVIELVNNKKKIAYVHSVKLYHHTVRDLNHFANKQKWATINALQKRNYGIAHRVNYLSENQQKRVKIWPLYAFSIVFPVIRSIWGLIREREPLWIFHPLLCIISACSSLSGVITFTFNKNAEYKRK